MRAVSTEQIHALADFRFTLRKFLHFSEAAATRAGLASQQHQLMLQIAGAPTGTVTAIGYLADRLSLRHNSVVELGRRCEEAGLVIRRSDPDNRRHVVLELTRAGKQILRQLSGDHSRELNELGPHLIEALAALLPERQPRSGQTDRPAEERSEPEKQAERSRPNAQKRRHT